MLEMVMAIVGACDDDDDDDDEDGDDHDDLNGEAHGSASTTRMAFSISLSISSLLSMWSCCTCRCKGPHIRQPSFHILKCHNSNWRHICHAFGLETSLSRAG